MSGCLSQDSANGISSSLSGCFRYPRASRSRNWRTITSSFSLPLHAVSYPLDSALDFEILPPSDDQSIRLRWSRDIVMSRITIDCLLCTVPSVCHFPFLLLQPSLSKVQGRYPPCCPLRFFPLCLRLLPAHGTGTFCRVTCRNKTSCSLKLGLVDDQTWCRTRSTSSQFITAESGWRLPGRMLGDRGGSSSIIAELPSILHPAPWRSWTRRRRRVPTVLDSGRWAPSVRVRVVCSETIFAAPMWGHCCSLCWLLPAAAHGACRLIQEACDEYTSWSVGSFTMEVGVFVNVLEHTGSIRMYFASNFGAGVTITGPASQGWQYLHNSKAAWCGWQESEILGEGRVRVAIALPYHSFGNHSNVPVWSGFDPNFFRCDVWGFTTELGQFEMIGHCSC